MYIPAKNLSESWEDQLQLIKNYPLATVVTVADDGKITANLIPFFFHIDETGKKYLHAHISKRNPQMTQFDNNNNVLIIFQSHDSYISPSYYPGKEETHKYVPTWDYASVQISGKSKLHNDSAWIKRQLNNFTGQNESGREKEWKLSDAPENYLNLKIKAIIGLEIEIVSIEAKFKFEQDMKRPDIEGVIKGLSQDEKPEVAEYVKQKNPV